MALVVACKPHLGWDPSGCNKAEVLIKYYVVFADCEAAQRLVDYFPLLAGLRNRRQGRGRL